MILSTTLIKINTLAHEIIIAQSDLVKNSKKINFNSISTQINKNREKSGNYSSVSSRTIKEYLKSNLKIKEIKK